VGPDLHCLGQIGKAKAHFRGVLGLSCFLGRLHRWDLLSFFGHLLGFSEESLHASGEVEGLDEGEALLAIVGDGEVGL